MTVTYDVALPFIRAADGTIAPGEAIECPSAGAAIIRAAISNSAQRQRGGFQPDRRSRVGVFDDAMVLKKFGKVPVDLTMLF
jgi:hypothetical protein